MTELTEKKDLNTIAAEIRTLQQQAQGILLSYAIEIGRRLYEAKAELSHGQWGDWLKEKVNYSQSTANNYMKLYDRYGQEQVSLFGGGNSESLKNMPYTKALKLLALPEEETEEFLTEHDVENMSTRELEQAIRERDEAKAEKQTMEEAVSKAAEEAKAAEEKAQQLQKELEELKNRPVEVAVEPPSEEMLQEIRAAEAAKYQTELEAMQKKLADAEDKAKKQADKVKILKEQAEKAGEKARAESKDSIAAAEKAKAEAEAAAKQQEKRAEELERKLKLADSSTAVFQVYFSAVQEDINRMLGLIQKADEETAGKFRAALRSLVDAIGGKL